jgi:hypothetical protein
MDQAGVTVDASALAVAQTLADATTSVAGKMTAADKTKLDGVATGATANSSDATLLARANHTGTQSANTITGLATVGTTGAYADLSGKPTLGTAAAKNVGTASGNVVELDGSARLPAVDGSQLTGINAATDLTYTAATRVLASSTGTDATLTLVTSADAGLAPASGGGTTNFLRADGTWAAAGSPPAGSDTQIQFNDGGAFGGDVDLTYNKTTNKLTTGGDIELNDGGSFTTTLQTVTPTAARTISLPNATGTVALVAGSSTAGSYHSLWGGFLGGIPFVENGALTVSNGMGYDEVNGILTVRGGFTTAGASTVLGTTTTGALTSTTVNGTTSTFTTGYNIGTSVELRADAVNIFSQFRTTNAQTYRLYNTFTSATNFERGKFAWERSTSDASTNGFISATTLTVDSGTGIAAGQIVTGTGVTPGTRIISGSGTSWVVSQSQTVGTTGARVAMVFGAPALVVGTEKGADGGTARALGLQTDNSTRVTIAADGSKTTFTGDVDLASTKVYKINDVQVVGGRVTGWTAPTGTATRSTFATYAGQDVSALYTEAEVQAIDDHVKVLSERLKALIDDLTTHGLIGT